MSELRIDINDKEFLAFLDRLKIDFAQRIKELMTGVAYTIQAKAVEYAPGDDGDLRQSIGVRKDPDTDLGYIISANAPYAAYVEFGTRFGDMQIPDELKELAAKFKAVPLIKATNLDADPYMYPALLYGRSYLVQQIKRDMDKFKRDNNLD